MSKIILSDVKCEERGLHKKIFITFEGLVSSDEAERCLALKRASILERTFEIPALVPVKHKQGRANLIAK